MRFEGRVAAITGAAGGLGRATARLLAAEGARLLLIDRDEAGLEETLAVCPGAVAAAADVTSAADLADARAKGEAAFGTIGLLAAAAGIAGSASPLVETSEEMFDRLMAVNVKGAFLAAKTFIPPMRAAGKGAVALFSSTAGVAGSNFLPAYSASKGAVTLMARSLALNHAREGVRVNCVCPGTIDSPMAEASLDTLAPDARAAQLDLLRALHPMGRLGLPEEVAQAVAYLLSDEAGWTTGVALPVDGGRLA